MTPISARSRRPTRVETSMLSSRRRAWSSVSTGVVFPAGAGMNRTARASRSCRVRVSGARRDDRYRAICHRLRGRPSQHILERVIVPQLVELDIFLEAFERGVAGELLEPGDVDALRYPTRNRSTPEAVAGEGRRIKAGEADPVLDNQRDRIGVDRTGTKPVAVGYRLSPGTPWNTWRRQAPDPPEQRTRSDRCGAEPGVERADRTQFGMPDREPQLRAAGVLVVLAPRQEEFDAVCVTGDVLERQPCDFARPQRRGEANQQQGAVAQSR